MTGQDDASKMKMANAKKGGLTGAHMASLLVSSGQIMRAYADIR